MIENVDEVVECVNNIDKLCKEIDIVIKSIIEILDKDNSRVDYLENIMGDVIGDLNKLSISK